MHEPYRTVTLARDVIGVLIPAGTKVELPEGASATVTQSLGNSYTVQVEGHLFRVEGKDADALGMEPPAAPEVPDHPAVGDVEKAVWEQLKTCYDPEIPVDIVNLGLVYECRVEPAGGGHHKALVRMTLTAPGCGMGEILVQDVREKLLQIPTVKDADVQLVFDPPWTRDMMSETAQLALGLM